jgi:uncharacterized protein with FMN-binding domain
MGISTLKPLGALVLTAVGSAFVLGFKTADTLTIDTGGQASGSTTTTAATTGGAASSSSSSTTSSGGSAASGSSTATYADGTWTGTAVSEPWGAFQVEVVVSGGSISAVSVVQAPTDRHSSSINNQAVPILTESVIASNGTSIDMVSGATWTSDSYATSLQSALDAASQAA